MCAVKAEECMVIHMCANNDRNGNPRRIFVVMHAGDIVDTVDEGYSGEHALDERFGQEIGVLLRARLSGRFETTPKEYRRLAKLRKGANSCQVVSG